MKKLILVGAVATTLLTSCVTMNPPIYEYRSVKDYDRVNYISYVDGKYNPAPQPRPVVKEKDPALIHVLKEVDYWFSDSHTRVVRH